MSWAAIRRRMNQRERLRHVFSLSPRESVGVRVPRLKCFQLGSGRPERPRGRACSMGAIRQSVAPSARSSPRITDSGSFKISSFPMRMTRKSATNSR